MERIFVPPAKACLATIAQAAYLRQNVPLQKTVAAFKLALDRAVVRLSQNCLKTMFADVFAGTSHEGCK